MRANWRVTGATRTKWDASSLLGSLQHVVTAASQCSHKGVLVAGGEK
jgi:hypothetical protein